MSKMLDLFNNEKLLEKVAVAETKEDAKKACAEAGVEMNDADLDEVAGGLSKTAKILIGVGAGVAGVAGATAIGVAGQKLGWWDKVDSVTRDGIFKARVKFGEVTGKWPSAHDEKNAEFYSRLKQEGAEAVARGEKPNWRC